MRELKELFDSVKVGVPCTISYCFAGKVKQRKGKVEFKRRHSDYSYSIFFSYLVKGRLVASYYFINNNSERTFKLTNITYPTES